MIVESSPDCIFAVKAVMAVYNSPQQQQQQAGPGRGEAG